MIFPAFSGEVFPQALVFGERGEFFLCFVDAAPGGCGVWTDVRLTGGGSDHSDGPPWRRPGGWHRAAR
eukprot:11165053-Lingulodinium_polyedra.AAC.1